MDRLGAPKENRGKYASWSSEAFLEAHVHGEAPQCWVERPWPLFVIVELTLAMLYPRRSRSQSCGFR